MKKNHLIMLGLGAVVLYFLYQQSQTAAGVVNATNNAALTQLQNNAQAAFTTASIAATPIVTSLNSEAIA